MKNGEERGFTAAEAQGLVRADKHPKSTRYGRQNPISERWNSEEQLTAWRAAWADVSNRCLERAGRKERIDHRSNAARGLDEIPTIHEGVTAQALEHKGIISDRCEINGKSHIQKSLAVWKPEMERYAGLVQQIKEKSKERKSLAHRITELTEDLEELRSEKSLLLQKFEYAEDAGAADDHAAKEYGAT